MRRRDVLKAAAALPLAWSLPGAARAGTGLAGDRILVLVELSGGPDGLSAVVPYADPAYGRVRRALAVPRDQVLQLDERLGLHPELKPLAPAWRDGDLAVALGTGYARPNRSHFRSIEIWNTGSDAAEFRQAGWVAGVLEEAAVPRRLAADAIVLSGPGGPVEGAGLRSVVLRRPEHFLRQARQLRPSDETSNNPALAHILAVRNEVDAAAREIETRLSGTAEPAGFPKGPFGRQLATAARLVMAGVPLACIKVAHGGFDTHAGQRGRLPRLLAQLGQGLAAFHAALVQAGAWDRVLVMTYAEFGRRVAENGSGGTDHGTAAPHFMLGGRVKGGLYGTQPALTDLEGGDLKHGLDFRRLYATAAQGWWGLPPTPNTLGRHRPLPCLA